MTQTKVIIITGASRGIGLAMTTHILATSTAHVVATARTTSALAELETRYADRVTVVGGDMADAKTGEAAVETAMRRWGRVDALVVNHATLDPIGRVAEADIDEWRGTWEVNVLSVVAIVKAAMPALRKSKGTLLFTSSGAAVKGTATWGAYSASKAVLNSLARTIAVEEPDVMTLAVRPGVVDTEMQATLRDQHFGKMSQADMERFKGMRERGEMLRPEQPGNVMARCAMEGLAGRELSGEFVNWNDEKLKDFQGL